MSMAASKPRCPPGDYAIEVMYLGQPVAKGLKLTVGHGRTGQSPDRSAKRKLRACFRKDHRCTRRTDPVQSRVHPAVTDVKLDFGPGNRGVCGGERVLHAQRDFNQPLPPGKYNVIISHGPEFDAIFTEIEIQPHAPTPLWQNCSGPSTRKAGSAAISTATPARRATTRAANSAAC